MPESSTFDEHLQAALDAGKCGTCGGRGGFADVPDLKCPSCMGAGVVGYLSLATATRLVQALMHHRQLQKCVKATQVNSLDDLAELILPVSTVFCFSGPVPHDRGVSPPPDKRLKG